MNRLMSRIQLILMVESSAEDDCRFKEIEKDESTFLLACGFWKPHLPFNALNIGIYIKGEDSVGIESLSTESIAEAGYFLR